MNILNIALCRRFGTSIPKRESLKSLIQSRRLNGNKLDKSTIVNETNKVGHAKVTLKASSITTFKLPSKDNEHEEVSFFRPGNMPPLTMTIDMNSLQETYSEVSDKIKSLDTYATKPDFVKLDSKEDEKPITTITDLMWRKVDDYDGKFMMFVKDVYMPLGKFRLSALVVMTAMEGYGMAPSSIAFDPLIFTSLLFGTTLTSLSANSINQFLESPYDSQMNRTKNRPLASGKISPLHAVSFATVAAGTGVAILWFGTNPLTAMLGLGNIVLYTSIYTPSKRLSIANTWIGSLVGAIPPMMGWAAATGALEPGAFVLGGLLYCWQFPHFNALSWNLRAEYSRAGYRMASVLDPDLCRRVCLRHSIAMLPLSVLAPCLEMTSWWFVVDSLPFNLYLIYLSYKFYKEGSSNSSKKLFRFSLVHIPVILLLMILSKNRTVASVPEIVE